MESSDSIDKSWDLSSEDMTTTAQRSDPLASLEPTSPTPGAWNVNVTGRDVVEMSHADLVSRWKAGEVTGSALVWCEGMENWAKLESVPSFQSFGPPGQVADDESSTTEDTNTKNLVAVYERPMATLVFDEAVEDEWKPVTKAREPSKSAKAAASSRPPAPSLPPLGPRVPRPAAVPDDVPPPPPPLPPRRQSSQAPAFTRLSDKPMPTIPGGLTAPTSSPPASGRQVKKSAPPANTTSSSPLLAAIAAAASSPEPVVAEVPAPAAPVIVTPVPAPVILDEVSVSARLQAMKSVSLRKAVLACVGSALVASLVTGLVVGSRSRQAARPASESPAKPALVATVAPSPTPPPEPVVAQQPQAPDTASVENIEKEKAEKAEKAEVAIAEPVAEKAKAPKPSKVATWKAPRPSATTDLAEAEKPASNPERDDPLRAVPDRVDDRSAAQPATWQDPGF